MWRKIFISIWRWWLYKKRRKKFKNIKFTKRRKRKFNSKWIKYNKKKYSLKSLDYIYQYYKQLDEDNNKRVQNLNTKLNNIIKNDIKEEENEISTKKNDSFKPKWKNWY